MRDNELLRNMPKKFEKNHYPVDSAIHVSYNRPLVTTRLWFVWGEQWIVQIALVHD